MLLVAFLRDMAPQFAQHMLTRMLSEGNDVHWQGVYVAAAFEAFRDGMSGSGHAAAGGGQSRRAERRLMFNNDVETVNRVLSQRMSRQKTGLAHVVAALPVHCGSVVLDRLANCSFLVGTENQKGIAAFTTTISRLETPPEEHLADVALESGVNAWPDEADSGGTGFDENADGMSASEGDPAASTPLRAVLSSADTPRTARGLQALVTCADMERNTIALVKVIGATTTPPISQEQVDLLNQSQALLSRVVWLASQTGSNNGSSSGGGVSMSAAARVHDSARDRDGDIARHTDTGRDSGGETGRGQEQDAGVEGTGVAATGDEGRQGLSIGIAAAVRRTTGRNLQKRGHHGKPAPTRAGRGLLLDKK